MNAGRRVFAQLLDSNLSLCTLSDCSLCSNARKRFDFQADWSIFLDFNSIITLWSAVANVAVARVNENSYAEWMGHARRSCSSRPSVEILL